MSSAMYLTLQPLHIFYEFLKLYMVRLITNWSKEIRNKDVLNKVNNMIFANFASIQIRTNKIMASASESASIGHSYAQTQMDALDQLKERLENLKKYDMEKEADKLLKFIEEILVKEEIRAYFSYKKNKRYRWDLKYKKDDVQDLAEYLYRHRDDFHS